MNFDGSCVAVCSSRSYPQILDVIKQLQAVDYTDKQLSVMGQRAKVTGEKTGVFSLFKLFRQDKNEIEFWGSLRDLLKGEVFFQTPEYDSIVLAGELSRVNLKSNHTENKHHSYTKVDSLLNRVGIPAVSFEYYQTVLKKGQSLLIIQGNYQELKRAGNLLDLLDDINVSLHLTNTS